jgi:DNA-binding LytR/AlgR family response regulator
MCRLPLLAEGKQLEQAAALDRRTPLTESPHLMHAEKAMRVLIVDDEPLARRRLVQLLSECPDVEIAGEAGGGREALKLLDLLRPDVLLLDVEMPGLDGFDVLRALSPAPAPAIIFVTAFQDHAVKAFELRATDFVVKPVSSPRLLSALEEARKDIEARRAVERLAFLQVRLAELEGQAISASDQGLWVQIGSDRRRLAIADIRWIEAERDYVRVHMTGHTHLVRALLGDMEKTLDEATFLRVHRSAIVRKDKVRAVLSGRFSAPVLELEDGQLVPVGRKYRDAVKLALHLPD